MSEKEQNANKTKFYLEYNYGEQRHTNGGHLALIYVNNTQSSDATNAILC